MRLKPFNPEKKLNRNYNKKHLIISLLVLIVMISIGSSYAIFSIAPESHVIINSKVGEFSTGDIKIAVLVDGEKQSEFPAKGSGYAYEKIECDNGSTGTWDSDTWQLTLTAQGPDKCAINFARDTISPVIIASIDTSSREKAIATVSVTEKESGLNSIRYYLNNSLYYEGTNTNYTFENLSAGTYQLKIECEDNAGNIGVFEQEITISACFVAGTLVLTENGYVPIEQIKVGDYVYTLNHVTNEEELNVVLNTITSETKEIFEITINDEVVRTTPRHEFYVIDRGYVRAYDLKVGDLVRYDNKAETIDSIKVVSYNEPIEVYNLTVENNHNYLVTKSKILVHNASSLT